VKSVRLGYKQLMIVWTCERGKISSWNGRAKSEGGDNEDDKPTM